MTPNAAPEPPVAKDGTGKYVLWCETCRRTEDCPVYRVEHFVREGWPWCCGRQMFCWAPRVR